MQKSKNQLSFFLQQFLGKLENFNKSLKCISMQINRKEKKNW